MSATGKVLIIVGAAFIFALIFAAVCLVVRLQKEKAKSEMAKQARDILFQKGNVDQLNPDFTAEEQAELLPYDKSFEVHKDKIKIGKTICVVEVQICF